MVVVKNDWLTLSEMKENASYIRGVFSSRGWSLNAICGVLGNMQQESTVNPGLWQGKNQGNLSGGFGLVQWTPATIYINWAQSHGYPNHSDWYAMDPELARIKYERLNNLQYYSTPSYPMSFDAFIKSQDSPKYLAEVFMNNYERPGKPELAKRKQYAQNWWDFFQGKQTGWDFVFPTPPDARIITSQFRPPGRPNHNGIDIASGNQAHYDIMSSTDGVVSRSYVSTSYGETVWIESTINGTLYEMVYAHMQTGSRKVQQGDKVNQCQKIGLMGSTGDSTGTHLHFEINLGGWQADHSTAVDPLPYIKGHTCEGSGPGPGPGPGPDEGKYKYWLYRHDTNQRRR